MLTRPSALFVVSIALAVASRESVAQAPPIVRASVADDGSEANGVSFSPSNQATSSDGRFVVFLSDATNLVAGDTNSTQDVFVRDLIDEHTVRVNVSSSGEEADGLTSYYPAISGNGRFVTFTSIADNLVANDDNDAFDVFVHDRDPDGNGIFDEGNGTTERVSVASDGAQGNSSSWASSISADGDVVAFVSAATNLIPIDHNNKKDVFVHVRSTGVTTRASVNASNIGGNDDSDAPEVSADGKTVVFISMANLVGTDRAGWDVFVRDLVNGVTERVSVDSNGVPFNDFSVSPSISADGRFVVFISAATGVFPEDDPSGTSYDVFLKDRVTGSVDCMTTDDAGFGGRSAFTCSISEDASKVAFASYSDVFVPADFDADADVFVRDVATHAVVCASVNCMGIPAGMGVDNSCSFSHDGRYVAITNRSGAFVDDDGNGSVDVFVNDLTNAGFQASWTNYGSGWPGTHGEPTLVTDVDPEFGATLQLSASNSWGSFAVGFLLLGFAEDSIVTRLGGTILVDADLLVPVIVGPTGWKESVTIPYDTVLCGMEADLQILEVDPGASKGVSFSSGLKLVFGR